MYDVIAIGELLIDFATQSADAEGNYVFMKSGKKMKQVKEILRESGKQVSMVENCGMETEHVYRSVDEIPDDAGYYSLIIAKEKAEEK